MLLGRSSIRHPLLVIEPGVSKTSSPSGSRTVASVTGPRGSPEGLTTVAQMLADGMITARIRSNVDRP